MWMRMGLVISLLLQLISSCNSSQSGELKQSQDQQADKGRNSDKKQMDPQQLSGNLQKYFFSGMHQACKKATGQGLTPDVQCHCHDRRTGLHTQIFDARSATCRCLSDDPEFNPWKKCIEKGFANTLEDEGRGALSRCLSDVRYLAENKLEGTSLSIVLTRHASSHEASDLAAWADDEGNKKLPFLPGCGVQ